MGKREQGALSSFVVIDDFFPDPAKVRAAAMSKAYEPPPLGSGRLALTARCDADETADMLKCLKHRVDAPVSAQTAEAQVLFRFTTSTASKQVECHYDACRYAGIVYLSLPEHCQGGTRFFRHVPTGDEQFDVDHAALYDFRDPEQWEVTASVDMKFNRLVFYPGHLFHAITPVFFGSGIEDGRLTQNVFLYSRRELAIRKLGKL